MLKASTNFIWCKLDKSCLGTTQDIYLCGAYNPPLNSTYFSPDIFEESEKDISFFNSQGSILLLGDLNARTGKYNDHLEMSDKNYLEIDMFENTENISQRNKCDNILNSHGKIVLQICKSFDLRILNGRKKGDSLGNITFHGRNGVSRNNFLKAFSLQEIFFLLCRRPVGFFQRSTK